MGEKSIVKIGKNRKNRKKNGKLEFSTIMVMILVGIVAMGYLLPHVGVECFIVRSGSMEPHIHTGSICIVNENVPYEEIGEGDIIAFEAAKDVLVTHRVVHQSEDGLQTKGDANEKEDMGLVTKETYLGKTVCAIPAAGYVLSSFQSVKKQILRKCYGKV